MKAETLEYAAEMLLGFSKIYHHGILKPYNFETSCDFIYNQIYAHINIYKFLTTFVRFIITMTLI